MECDAMRYEQSAEQSAELLRLILPRIGLHGSHFTPAAYAVWYEHLAGINPALSDALEARLRQNRALTHPETVELYGDHIQSREMRSLTQLKAGLGELLRKLGDIAAQSSKGAAEYYRALAAHEQELASIVDANAQRRRCIDIDAMHYVAGSARDDDGGFPAPGHEDDRVTRLV